METKPPNDEGLEPAAERPAPARFFSRRVTPQSPAEALQPDRPPPPPPHRRRPALSAVSGFLSFLLIVSVVGLFGVLWGAHRIREPGPLSADKVLFIAPGTDFPDIVAALGSEGVIDNELIFNIAVLVEGRRSKIKAGEYLFRQSASMRDVIDILVSGRQVLHPVTIPEGLTSEQIVERLRHNDLLAGDIREVPKEGSLLPETYKVPRGMQRRELLKRMHEDEKKLVAQVWAHRSSDLTLRSPYELVTLASIVEKETGKADERPRVAAVFLNRLRKHMRLQSDPTIVYGLVGGKGTLGRPILRSEVEKPTPYNTYVIQGLPPGPITNPGRAALDAVANPSHTNDLYFVADGSGGHVFSQTLEQHQRNVQRWRQIEKEAKEKASPEVDKFVPATPAGRGNSHGERGELEGTSIYGVLPTAVDSAAGGIPAPSLGMAAVATAIANVAPQLPSELAMAAAKPGHRRDLLALQIAPPSSLAIESGFDQLRFSVRGVPDPRAAAELLDGPVDASASAATPPANGSAVSAGVTQAQDQEKAVALGLAAATGEVLPPSAAAKLRQSGNGIHSAVFDASEGTSFDPLLDKSYDLNYPKTVPTSATSP
ncbi:endolytic transglycosylase MltG [Methylovirgula sp. HY1]|uniref:endolytic transglycosylase MltG n=1 Tax=Methylovirgula sp. HY1 TaxID=2822761 RepID=UPI001C5BBC40|nr:endolytic transglycosylase MltG [Methylovirgula sp. HY1]QXX74361.1 Endolytic murein transglycosylase [Methylovirgula sp. HY1]